MSRRLTSSAQSYEYDHNQEHWEILLKRIRTMTRNELMLNIIAGTNYEDEEDIVIRHALACAVRERYLDDFVRRSTSRRWRAPGGLGRRHSSGSCRRHPESAVHIHRRLSSSRQSGCHRAQEIAP
jgi:hypothetical protein